MSCAESLRLIAGAMEGRVAPQALDALVEHLEQCDACRFEAEMQRAMQQIVASRPDEPLPDGLAKRIAERLDREGPIVRRTPTDWRRLTLRLAPAAAALIVLAVLARRPGRPGESDLSRQVVRWGQGEFAEVHPPSGLTSMTDAAAFGLMLLHDPETRPKEGPQ